MTGERRFGAGMQTKKMRKTRPATNARFRPGATSACEAQLWSYDHAEEFRMREAARSGTGAAARYAGRASYAQDRHECLRQTMWEHAPHRSALARETPGKGGPNAHPPNH